MKRLSTVLIIFGCFMSPLAFAQQWTLYYSQTATANGDGSLTVTPTVSIVGNDGGYCSPLDQNFGVESPAVMLNGNTWQIGDGLQSGDSDGLVDEIDFAYTFPSVMLPSDGTPVDMSYAAKVHGVCYGNHNGSFPPYSQNAFYINPFVDGVAPTASPAPCWIIDNSPPCLLPWPALWTSVPRYGVQRNLYSQAKGIKVGLAKTFVLWIGGQLQGHCATTRNCSNTSTPRCPIASIWVGDNGTCSPAWKVLCAAITVGDAAPTCYVNWAVQLTDTSPGVCTPQ